MSALLTILTLSVIQLGLALLIRNTVQDAASEGARYAALADNRPEDGVSRTTQLIEAAIGPAYAKSVRIAPGSYNGFPAYTVTVDAPLPLFGLIGISRGLEVTGHAAVETLP